MNKCKICKKTISDGSEYCSECLDKKEIITDESYLDNLLNSVMEESITARDIYDKKSGRGQDSAHLDKASDSVELSDILDFENLDISEDLEEPVDVDIEDLIGSQADFNIDYADTDADNTENKELNSNTLEDTETGPETAAFDAADGTGKATDNADMSDTGNVAVTDSDADNLYNNIDTEFLGTDYRDEYIEYEEEIADSSLDDMLKQFDVSSDDASSGEMEPVDDMSGINGGLNAYSEDKEKKGKDEVLMDDNISPEDELLRLLNQFNPDDPITDDIQSITELLGGLEQELQGGNYSDFTDTASSNISVEVKEKEEKPDNGIKYITPEDDEKVKDPGKEKKKSKKAKKKDEAKEGKGILQRLFGNIKDEEAESGLFAAASDSTEDPGKTKKKKRKKGKKTASNEEADGGEAAAASRWDSEDDTENNKKPKKAKKEKKKKAKVVVIEEEIDEGRINRVGASIVFAFFAVLVILLMVTTNAFAYRQNIKNASKFFERKEYAQAYNEIYGLDLKDKDVELYNKIKTVMIVNKQLESYKNYYDMRMFPEALDSLLKGLKRYEKYIELATMLGIKEDLDYIRDRIVDELYYVFSLSEEEAEDILSIESQPDYTKAVYDAVHDIITYY